MSLFTIGFLVQFLAKVRADIIIGPGNEYRLIVKYVGCDYIRGTQRIVSVNYMFEKPLIPYNFLLGIYTSNVRDIGNLRPYKCFWIDKNVVSDTEKRSAKIFGKEIRPKVFGKWTKNAPVISKRIKFP